MFTLELILGFIISITIYKLIGVMRSNKSMFKGA